VKHIATNNNFVVSSVISVMIIRRLHYIQN